jgi:hypothetical protein
VGVGVAVLSLVGVGVKGRKRGRPERERLRLRMRLVHSNEMVDVSIDWLTGWLVDLSASRLVGWWAGGWVRTGEKANHHHSGSIRVRSN